MGLCYKFMLRLLPLLDKCKATGKDEEREPPNVKVQKTASKYSMVCCEILFLNANQTVLLGCLSKYLYQKN